MKKFFTLLMATLTISMVTYGQIGTTETVISKVDTMVSKATAAVSDATIFVDTSSTFRMIYSDVKSGILGLAASLKVGAEHVYKVIVKQQVVLAIKNLILVIFIFAVWFFVLYILKRNWNNFTNEHENIRGLIVVILVCLFIVPLIVLGGNLESIVTGFVNPEYGAIKAIFEMTKSGTIK